MLAGASLVRESARATFAEVGLSARPESHAVAASRSQHVASSACVHIMPKLLVTAIFVR